MGPDELLDYALGRLDGPRLRRLERRIARDPAFAERVARLVHNVSRILDDGRDDRPRPIGPLPTAEPSSRPRPPARSDDPTDRPAPDS